MKFPKFHRPEFVKNTPELNALTSKGKQEANAALLPKEQNSTQNATGSSPKQRYKESVNALRNIVVSQNNLVLRNEVTSSIPTRTDGERSISSTSQYPETENRSKRQERPLTPKLPLELFRGGLANI